MAFSKKCLLFFCLAAALFQASMARVHHVGGNEGWSIEGAKAYRHWPANWTFEVGTSFVFKYKPKFHNVLQVSHDAYKDCDLHAPLATYKTGYDTITINETGRYFFVDGIKRHCQDGQKIVIRVCHRHHHLAPVPAPLSSVTVPSPLHSPPNNNSAAPAPVSVTGPSPSLSTPNNNSAAPAPVSVTDPSPSLSPSSNNDASSTTSMVGGAILGLLLGFVLF